MWELRRSVAEPGVCGPSSFPPPDTFKRGHRPRAVARGSAGAACVACTLCARARARTHALLARARTPSARKSRSPRPPLRCLHANHYGAQRFTRRPFHASSDALRLTLRLAKQAFECVHKWVGAASASTSLPLCPDCRRAVPTVRHGCLGAGPSRRTLRWLVVAPPHISWLPRVARSNALCMLPAPTHADTCLRLGAGTDAMLSPHLCFKPEALASDDADVRRRLVRLRHRRRRHQRLRHRRRRRQPLRGTVVRTVVACTGRTSSSTKFTQSDLDLIKYPNPRSPLI